MLVPRERVRAAMGSRSWACGAGVGAGLRVLAGTVVHWSWRGAGCAGGGSTPGVGAPGCTPGAVVLALLVWSVVLWVSCWGAPLEVDPFALGGVGSREGWSVVC